MGEGTEWPGWVERVLEMLRNERKIVSRLAGPALVALACSVALPEFGVSGNLAGSYLLLSLGLVWVVETTWGPRAVKRARGKVAISAAGPEKPSSPDADSDLPKGDTSGSASEAAGKVRAEWMRWLPLLEAVLVIEIAVAVGWSVRPHQSAGGQGSQGQGQQQGSNARTGSGGNAGFGGQTGTPAGPGTPGGAGGTGGTGGTGSTGSGGASGGTVRLNPALEKALLDALSHPPAGGAGLPWGIVLIILVGLVVVGYVGKKHSEVIPVAGAAGLAAEVIKHPDQFSRLSVGMFWTVLVVFLVIAVSFAATFVGGAIWLWRGKAQTVAESAVTKDVLSLSFSVVTLVWAVVMVTYRGEAAARGAQLNAKPAQVSVVLEERRLAPEPFYNKGLATRDASTPAKSGRFADLKQVLAAGNWKKGDMLLLFGSTDCVEFRPAKGESNDALALGRANELKGALQEFAASGLDIEANALPQHEMCRETPGLRAVYPFLIRGMGSVGSGQ